GKRQRHLEGRFRNLIVVGGGGRSGPYPTTDDCIALETVGSAAMFRAGRAGLLCGKARRSQFSGPALVSGLISNWSQDRRQFAGKHDHRSDLGNDCGGSDRGFAELAGRVVISKMGLTNADYNRRGCDRNDSNRRNQRSCGSWIAVADLV